MKLNNSNKIKFLTSLLMLKILILISFNSYSQNFNNKSNQKNFYEAEFIIGEEKQLEGVLLTGLKIKLDKGWKIYWKNPGDAGLPPEINWDNVKNIKHLELLYPAPKRFDFFGIDTFGYEKYVILPIKIYKNDINKPIEGILELNAQICNKICVPINKKININSLSKIHLRKSYTKEINRFLNLVPFENDNKKFYFEKISLNENRLKILFKILLILKT